MLEEALRELKSGKPILLFDGERRERETDIVIPSQFVTNDVVRIFRKQGGGLICTTLKEENAKKLGLPFIEDFYREHLRINLKAFDASDLKYDRGSSFSVTINHRDTFTGIPDMDRSKTIVEFSKFLGSMQQYNGQAGDVFSHNFRIPGHVILIIAREGYFKHRKGHTELSTYLVEKAGLIPSATIVEMLDDNGSSLSKGKAIEFAKKNSLSFIEGKDIIDAWNNDQSHGYGSL